MNRLRSTLSISLAEALRPAFAGSPDAVEFIGTAIAAGAEQVTNIFPGYGYGAEGYPKQFGAAYADDVLGWLIAATAWSQRADLTPTLKEKPGRHIPGRGRSRAGVHAFINFQPTEANSGSLTQCVSDSAFRLVIATLIISMGVVWQPVSYFFKTILETKKCLPRGPSRRTLRA